MDHATGLRSHRRRFRSPRGRRGRSPQRQDRAIGYYARDIPTALAETFQSGRLVDRRRDQPWLASFPLARDLQLLDLTGTFAVQAGGSMKLVSGPRNWSQNGSRAFYECYPEVEGIYYPSSSRTCLP